jgi:hypothetical protein
MAKKEEDQPMASWNALSNQPSFSADTMLLLTDGTVMCHQELSANWFRLTPDSTGSFAKGSWSSLASLPNNPAITAAQNGPANAPLYFASAVLRDGRVYMAGGEYNVSGGTPVDMGPAQIYDPLADAWTIVTPPPDLVQIGDAITCVLADGRLIIGDSSSGSTAVDILDPTTMIYETTGAKSDSPSEETWTLLPNGNVLAVECSNAPNAEQYNPTTNAWISAGSTPGKLPQPCTINGVVDVPEIGPALLLPDGRVFAIGATGATALYTPDPDPTKAGTWTAGPTLNDGHGNTLYPMDAPAVLLPNGKVLLTASPGPPCNYPGPTTFLLYDPSTNTAPPVTGPSNAGGSAFSGRLLLLPDGSVLYSANTNDIEVYSPDAGGDASWAPVITDAASTMVIGRTYTVSGTQFNGLSQACSYGDDAQMATNYPIARLTNGSTTAYLRTASHSTMGVATGTQLVTTEVTVIGPNVTAGDWQLQIVANGIASNAVPVTIAAQGCLLQIQNSDFSAGQITALIESTGAAKISQAASVVVQGFKQTEIGNNTPLIPNPAPSISFAVSGPPVPTLASLPASAVQDFTFIYDVTFTDTSAFGSSDQPLPVSVNFTSTDAITVQTQGQIELLATPNPYILHGDAAAGDPFYLSVDLGVFQVTAGGPVAFGASIPTSGSVKTNAKNFIHSALQNLNKTGSTVTGQFAATVAPSSDSIVNLLNADSSGNPIYNFALARVRFQDINPANNVRAFFRLWQAQQTNATYDTSTYYRSATSGTQKIPLLGLEGGEIVTIPFFAAERIDSTSADMTTQTDPDNVVATIQPGAGGALVETYFGCWLDVNQNDAIFPPWMEGVTNQDGPYNGGEPLVSILQLVKATHQCLIAEIAYDPDPIAAGLDPSNSDKLAQSNLSFINIPNPGLEHSRVAAQTFEIKPSRAVLLADKRPDELMIEWGNTPRGSTAQIYLPAVLADDIVAWTDKLYPVNVFTRIDAHTLSVKAEGITYLPVPQSSSGLNYMGLMTVTFPRHVHKGDLYGITVRQLTSASAFAGGQTTFGNVAADARRPIIWRRVAGIFHLAIPVSTKAQLAEPEASLLAILRYIEQSIPFQSRWYPVFRRFVDVQAGKVGGLGIDPAKIPPNWQGLLPGSGHGAGAGYGGKTGGGKHPGSESPGSEVCCYELRGKIAGLRYDHFGGFEGFLLETGCCEPHFFRTREPEIECLVRRALADRSLLAVEHAPHDPCCVAGILIIEVPRSCCGCR